MRSSKGLELVNLMSLAEGAALDCVAVSVSVVAVWVSGREQPASASGGPKMKPRASRPSAASRSMNAGCEWSNKPHVWQPFDADHTKDMLTSSVDMNSTGNLGAKTLGITMYNEVLVDSKDLMSHMPKSIGAFVFFDDDEYNHNKPSTMGGTM